MQTLEKDHYGARTLIREVVLSVPFRESQTLPSAAPVDSKVPARRLPKDDTP
jgi:hypothetical protein